MTRLSETRLSTLPADVVRPGYDRAQVRRGVVHLGIGAFHRAHQAVVFDDAMAAGDLRWGITAVSLRSPGVRDRLAPQDGLYTLVERDGSHERARVIGAIGPVLVAPEDPSAVVAALAAPDTHIVTLTITEKGYKLRENRLDPDDAEVAHDLRNPAAPRSAVGFLVAGLAARRAAGLAPFTTISCDNLPHNGRLLRDAVLAMAQHHDAELAEWIEREAAFPQTMVDRIVPATDDDDIAAFRARTGIEDQALVKTEPFLQWVIEDRFCGPRPDFAALGVQLTGDVAPWEEAKLRLLNGAHSGIAYLGGLAGVEFVHEFVAHPAARRFVDLLWDESAATLNPPPGLDIAQYRADLMARFANPALQHRTRQIAMDGSLKLPQRLLAPIATRLERGESIDALALAATAWMRWQGGVDDAGQAFVVDDPLASVTAERLAGLAAADERVDALLAVEAIFPSALAAQPAFRAALVRHLGSLDERGAWATMEELVR